MESFGNHIIGNQEKISEIGIIQYVFHNLEQAIKSVDQGNNYHVMDEHYKLLDSTLKKATFLTDPDGSDLAVQAFEGLYNINSY